MKKRILIAVSVILILCIGFAAFWYFTYLYKYNQIVEFRNDRDQDIYMLGTYHSQHFNQSMGYSMADIVNCIKNVDPDVVLIEAREETFDRYGAIDGPIDTGRSMMIQDLIRLISTEMIISTPISLRNWIR